MISLSISNEYTNKLDSLLIFILTRLGWNIDEYIKI